jgi:hypothetical protein
MTTSIYDVDKTVDDNGDKNDDDDKDIDNNDKDFLTFS